MGADLTGDFKWVGGILAPNGKIYGIPSYSTDILIIDPTTDTATRSNMGADLTDTQKWVGGILAPNGKIYGIPRDSTDILTITPDFSPTTYVPIDICLSSYYNKF